MAKFILNLFLVIITGYAFIWSYNNLIATIKQHYKSEAQHYIDQNTRIEDFQSQYPKPLSKKAIIEFDKKNGTNLALAIDKSQTLEGSALDYVAFRGKKSNENDINNILSTVKYENQMKVSEIAENANGFWSYLPPTPALIFGGLGIFLTALITKLAESFYSLCNTSLSCICSFFKKILE